MEIKQFNEELEIKLSKWEKQFSDADKDFARVCFKKGVDWAIEQKQVEIDLNTIHHILEEIEQIVLELKQALKPE